MQAEEKKLLLITTTCIQSRACGAASQVNPVATAMLRATLSCFVGLNLLNRRVEVENVDPLGPLAFQNRAYFCLKELQLPRVH
jgi:hypothetical protein